MRIPLYRAVKVKYLDRCCSYTTAMFPTHRYILFLFSFFSDDDPNEAFIVDFSRYIIWACLMYRYVVMKHVVTVYIVACWYICSH